MLKVESESHSVMSDSLQTHIAHQVLCPWNSPGKNTGVGCHFLLQGLFLTQGLKLSLLYFWHWTDGVFISVPLPLAKLSIKKKKTASTASWNII